MASINKLHLGQVLHDYHKYKMGNTNILTEGYWTVRVVQIDREKKRALCSWNGNPPTWYSEKQLKRLRVSPN